MKKIVVFSFFAHGHINPIVPVIRDLVKKGHQVTFYGTQEFKAKITSTGADFKTYPPNIYDFDHIISRDMIVFGDKLVEKSEYTAKELLSTFKKDRPDFIIHDGLCLWAKLIASRLKIPAISYVVTFGITRRLIPTYPNVGIPLLINSIKRPRTVLRTLLRYDRLTKEYNLRNGSMVDMLMNKEEFNIIFTSSVLQPLKSRFLKNYIFVGPSIYDRKEKDFLKGFKKDGKKLIYVSMGTIFNDNLTFYKKLIEIFTNTSYIVIISLGARFKISQLPKLPKNIIVANHIPQLEVLKKTDLFITHGGANSINESLYFGVPMILVPQMLEQRLNAKRIEKLGVGLYFKNTRMTNDELLRAVEQIISDKKYYQKAQSLSETLKQSGGYKKAASLINDYVNTH